MLSALKVVKEIDAGPIYMKHPLDLLGRAEDIYIRMADLIWDMIAVIVSSDSPPTPQKGIPTLFSRRTPDQCEMPSQCSMDELYDHIRMMDAPGYPLAFLSYGSFFMEFTEPVIDGDFIFARV